MNNNFLKLSLAGTIFTLVLLASSGYYFYSNITQLQDAVTGLDVAVTGLVGQLDTLTISDKDQTARITELELKLTPALDQISTKYGVVKQTQWSAFADGQRILSIEVDITNNSYAEQTLSAEMFKVTGTEGIPLKPVHLSKVAEQPRFKNGVTLETNRSEIRETKLAPNSTLKGILVFFVAANPKDSYLVTFNEDTNLLEVSD